MSELNQNPLILQYISHNHFGKLLGMDFNIIEPGKVEYRIKIEQKHLATPSSSHGGLIAALLDATVGVGALSLVCTDDKVVSTIEIKVNFLEPVLLMDTLLAHSKVIKQGKRILFMQGQIINQSERLVANCSATLNVYPKEYAGY